MRSKIRKQFTYLQYSKTNSCPPSPKRKVPSLWINVGLSVLKWFACKHSIDCLRLRTSEENLLLPLYQTSIVLNCILNLIFMAIVKYSSYSFSRSFSLGQMETTSENHNCIQFQGIMEIPAPTNASAQLLQLWLREHHDRWQRKM